MRFRYADGFSHSRALAFQFVLTLVPGLIALVGLARVLDQDTFTEILHHPGGGRPRAGRRDLHPGVRAGSAAAETAETALVVGLSAALISAATAMGQIERGSNRIYGVERDRPAMRKYAVAAGLALSAGRRHGHRLRPAGLRLRARRRDRRGEGLERGRQHRMVDRPLAARRRAGRRGAIALLFKVSPNRQQPDPSWLALGSAIAVFLWFAFTGVLALFIGASQEFGETYGPLAGTLGLLLWAFVSALALFLGLAVAAQLEAERAGEPRPDLDLTAAAGGDSSDYHPQRH